jgi:DNA-binding XRE family transcriptional regulator
MTGRTSWSDLRERRATTPERRTAARESLENEIAAYRLVELRKARGLTQKQVADAMGVSQRRVSAIEHGDVDRSELTTLRNYIQALGGQIHVVAQFDEITTQIA